MIFFSLPLPAPPPRKTRTNPFGFFPAALKPEIYLLCSRISEGKSYTCSTALLRALFWGEDAVLTSRREGRWDNRARRQGENPFKSDFKSPISRGTPGSSWSSRISRRFTGWSVQGLQCQCPKKPSIFPLEWCLQSVWDRDSVQVRFARDL